MLWPDDGKGKGPGIPQLVWAPRLQIQVGAELGTRCAALSLYRAASAAAEGHVTSGSMLRLEPGLAGRLRARAGREASRSDGLPHRGQAASSVYMQQPTLVALLRAPPTGSSEKPDTPYPHWSARRLVLYRTTLSPWRWGHSSASPAPRRECRIVDARPDYPEPTPTDRCRGSTQRCGAAPADKA